ncbi:MAG: hypothetical protein NY202_05290 [Mollicutes bacterium UO1]
MGEENLGTETEQTNTPTNGTGGGKDSGTDRDDSDNNSESSSDHGSDNEREKNNDMPEVIQEIANLPLLQAKNKAKGEIKKFLQDAALSEEELGAEN